MARKKVEKEESGRGMVALAEGLETLAGDLQSLPVFLEKRLVGIVNIELADGEIRLADMSKITRSAEIRQLVAVWVGPRFSDPPKTFHRSMFGRGFASLLPMKEIKVEGKPQGLMGGARMVRTALHRYACECGRKTILLSEDLFRGGKKRQVECAKCGKPLQEQEGVTLELPKELEDKLVSAMDSRSEDSHDGVMPRIYAIYPAGKAPGLWSPQTRFEGELLMKLEATGRTARPMDLEEQPRHAVAYKWARKAMSAGWINEEELYRGFPVAQTRPSFCADV